MALDLNLIEINFDEQTKRIWELIREDASKKSRNSFNSVNIKNISAVILYITLGILTVYNGVIFNKITLAYFGLALSSGIPIFIFGRILYSFYLAIKNRVVDTVDLAYEISQRSDGLLKSLLEFNRSTLSKVHDDLIKFDSSLDRRVSVFIGQGRIGLFTILAAFVAAFAALSNIYKLLSVPSDIQEGLNFVLYTTAAAVSGGFLARHNSNAAISYSLILKQAINIKEVAEKEAKEARDKLKDLKNLKEEKSETLLSQAEQVDLMKA